MFLSDLGCKQLLSTEHPIVPMLTVSLNLLNHICHSVVYCLVAHLCFILPCLFDNLGQGHCSIPFG